MPTSPGRLSRGRPTRCLLSVATAGALLLVAGCTDGGTPPAPGSATPSRSTSSAPATTSPSPTPSVPSVPSVSEVFRDARTASLSAESGHVVGTVKHDGAKLRIDVEGQANGSNQTVFITTPKGGTAEVLTVGDGWWVGGDEAHWTEITGDPKAATALVGKYAAVTESDATELGSYTLRTILTDAFAEPDIAVLESDTTPATETELDGRPAYLLGRPGGPRLWVAADGSGTLLRLVGPKSDPSDLTFTDWDRARTFTEPPPDEVIEN